MPISSIASSNLNSYLPNNIKENSARLINWTRQKGYDALKYASSFGIGILKGASLYALYEANKDFHTTKNIKILRVFQDALFEPSQFKTDPQRLKKIIEYIVSLGTNETINRINSTAILDSSCPLKEYHHQFDLFNQGNVDREWLRTIFLNTLEFSVILGPCIEEVFFRGILQDIILKKVVAQTVKKVSPSHANLVDSKIYTAIRIGITAYIFSTMHESNRIYMSDSDVDYQVSNALIMGLALGVLKEFGGLSFAIGGHVINNLANSLPGIMAKC